MMVSMINVSGGPSSATKPLNIRSKPRNSLHRTNPLYRVLCDWRIAPSKTVSDNVDGAAQYTTAINTRNIVRK